ncbi:fimbria/pilus outer membrane usher protein [Erwinia psidii]|uniref:Fimbrial biogenesis outer membrane usher protein n=1 Tax=Erwinia psidii TaxID=69224 RepID=A0A3N6TQZ2_9GAMM|nr:fimbria/pilus outer membrane usher protein [Erwinia psidii]MCX8955829.1 fimbrial biogenesis outer membrane usher protein [Erwinia psidii]MCX8961614.1 fimbrial biogenesis outer membrane usher protein [Erwinia psidii]MCX8965714.1 fimbrial biogenesis outer membrane usher protein [Erwinia psidii]RQM37662.1 fimbrial biogenesis outer membrane usher protein [Erwinia psidii]
MTLLPNQWYRLRRIAVPAIVLFLSGSVSVRAELYFNTQSLRLNQQQREQADLSRLASVDAQLPGEYDVSVRVNMTNIGKQKLHFLPCGNQLCAMLTPALLRTWGVKLSAIPALSSLSDDEPLNHPGDYITDFRESFDFEQQQLNITFPQAVMDNSHRGYIPPARWENGLPMLFSSYSYTGSQTKYRGEGMGSIWMQYLNLRNGINLGAWRIRNYSYLAHSNTAGTSWNSMQTWIERDLPGLQSRLTVGEAITPGLVFDSMSYHGVSLSSQDEMRPDSMRGYAPEIRGIALSNAMVEVLQNGNLLYQTFVTPGSFVINDLYATSTSGDLQIRVHEEDGTVREFTQAFASPPVSVRNGVTRFSTTFGQYSPGSARSSGKTQRFWQGEVLHGISGNTSLYGGAILADNYQSGLLGVGQGLGDLGALSLDITHAVTTFVNENQQKGQSLRLRYSKNFDSTGTNVAVAGYRYSTGGYYSFDEASENYFSQGYSGNQIKNRIQISMSQNAGQLGSLSLSAWQQQYRGRHSPTSRSVAGNWSKNFNGIAVGLSQSQNRSSRSRQLDNVTSASISLPLGRWLGGENTSLRQSNRITHSSNGLTSMTTMLSGSTLGKNNLSYSLAQSRSRQSGNQTSDGTALSLSWQGDKGTYNAGYSNFYGQNERLTWGVNGSMVVHPYGITLAQSLPEGSSYALVRAPGAQDVRVLNRSGVATDSRGYAVVPTLTPYRENEISLDTGTLSDNVDLLNPSHSAVPVREALVLTDYQTLIGYRLFIRLQHAGKPLPFGTVVSAGQSSGIADEHGQVFISGVPDKTVLTAALSDGKSCKADFDTRGPGIRTSGGLLIASLECQ